MKVHSVQEWRSVLYRTTRILTRFAGVSMTRSEADFEDVAEACHELATRIPQLNVLAGILAPFAAFDRVTEKFSRSRHRATAEAA